MRSVTPCQKKTILSTLVHKRSEKWSRKISSTESRHTRWLWWTGGIIFLPLTKMKNHWIQHPDMPTILRVRKFFEKKEDFPTQYCTLASAVLLEILINSQANRSIGAVAGFSGDNMPHVFLHDHDHNVYIDITPDQLGLAQKVYIWEDPILPRSDALEEFIWHTGVHPRTEVAQQVALILSWH